MLWGMGGIGKTTAARELFRLLQPRFESASCFVANVRERAEQREVPQMQQQILKELCDWNDAPLPSDADAGMNPTYNYLHTHLNLYHFVFVLVNLVDDCHGK